VTLISSRMTFFSKRVFPALWFGFLGLFVISSVTATRGRQIQPALLVIPIVMSIFGYFLMKKMVLDLVDEVWDDGTELVVKNKGQIERIPLTNIINVSYSFITNPPRVTLSLRNPGLLGKEITFSPPARLMPFSRSPIVNELIERIDAARPR
jgi:hypothetical protein